MGPGDLLVTQLGDPFYLNLCICMVHMKKKSADLYYLEADAILLALCGRVRVVTTKHQTVAREPAVLRRKLCQSEKNYVGH